jgi:hypothetical protein
VSTIDADGERIERTTRGRTLDAACIEAETLSVPIDDSHIEQARGVHTIDAALIDFDSRGFTIDAACIAAVSTALAITTRGLAIDAACIDRETLPSPVDDSHIDALNTAPPRAAENFFLAIKRAKLGATAMPDVFLRIFVSSRSDLPDERVRHSMRSPTQGTLRTRTKTGRHSRSLHSMHRSRR